MGRGWTVTTITRPLVLTPDLFEYSRRNGFEGMTERDMSGLQEARRRVWKLMRDGQWHDATEIIDVAEQREGLKRLRELRSLGYVVERGRTDPESREWRYRLVEAVPA